MCHASPLHGRAGKWRWGHLRFSISELIALGECLCTAWEIQSDPRMDAALTSSQLQVSAKREGEVDPGNLSPVIVFLFFYFCLGDI